MLLRHAKGKGMQEAGDRYGLGAGDRRFHERCDRGEGVLVTPKGVARVKVTPSPWLLELMGGPKAASEVLPGSANTGAA